MSTTFILIILILSIISIYFAFKEDKVDEKYTDFGTKENTYKHDDWYDKSTNHSKIEKIFNLIVKDFNNSPYNDKYEIQSISSFDYISFIYKFDNGYSFKMISDCISIYDRNNRSISSYTLSPHYYKIFLELVLEINQKSKSRYNQNSRQYYKRDYQQKVNEEPKVKSTGNQRLDKILEKIKLREDQLSKMSKNDPNRSSLINELETYKNVANKMKSKIK